MFLSELLFYFLTLIIIILTIKSPVYGLVGYYAFSVFRPQEVYWYTSLYGSRLSFYIAIVTIFSAFINKSKRDSSVKRVNFLTLFFPFLLILALNSYFMSVNQQVSYHWLILFSKLMLMCFVTILVLDTIKQIRIMFFVLVVVIGYLAYLGNEQYFSYGIWKITFPGRATIDNNGYAMILSIGIPFAFFLFFSEKNIFLRIGVLLTIPLMIHGITLTYSRGGFIGMAIAVMGCILYLKKKKWAVLAGCVFLIAISRLQGLESEKRIGTVFEYEKEASAQSRFDSWRAGLNMMQDNPLAGVGIGNFNSNAYLYSPVITTEKAAHNAFISIGGEMGVIAFCLYIGGVLYVFLLLLKIRNFYKKRKNEIPHFYYASALLTTFLAIVVCGMFLTLSYFELHYFIMALVGVLINIYKRDKLESESKILTA